MSEPEPRQPDQAMLRHIMRQLPEGNSAAREWISERYARFYAPLALGSVVIAFLPLFNDVEVGNGSSTMRTSYGTVFDMAARPGGGPAVVGMMLLAALVGLLCVGAFRVRRVGLPVAVAVVAALIAVMLIAKPGTGTPTPDLSVGGRAGLAIAICAIVVALAHAIHLALAKEPTAETPAPSEPRGRKWIGPR